PSHRVEPLFGAKQDIELEISLTPPPDLMPVGGYIDEFVTSENGRELTILGWSPLLAPREDRNKLVIYSSEETLAAEICRHGRADIEEKYQQSGFACWLAFPRAIKDRFPIMTVLGPDGRQYRLVSATQKNSALLPSHRVEPLFGAKQD